MKKNKKKIIIISAYILGGIIILGLAYSFISFLISWQKTALESNCEGNLKTMGIIVQEYHEKHGNYPNNLYNLPEIEAMKYQPTCPTTDEKYIYEKTIDGFIIYCPNPEKHKGYTGSYSKCKYLLYDSEEGVIPIDSTDTIAINHFECKMNIRKIAAGIVEFKSRYNRYPESLEQLSKYISIDASLFCPESKSKYIYQKSDNHFRISCPDPQTHSRYFNVYKLYYDSEEGFIHEYQK
ncbi:MAG: hypothetical protein PHV06_08440 [bacterium]|nr:hypothetical protein [bacterium]